MVLRAQQLWMDFLLFAATFFWGITFIIVKNAVALVDVYVFLGVRFGIAFIVMALLFRKRMFPFHLPTARAGVFLGVFLFAAFAFQTWGLTHTSATNGAFLTGMNVVMVPILSLIFLRRAPAPFAVLGVLLAFTGLYFLTGGAPSDWNRGDLLVFICAVWVSIHIMTTGYYAPKYDTMALAAWQIGAVAALNMGFALGTGSFTLHVPLSVWGAVLVTALFCTVFAFAVQTHAQRYTSPTRTALIFTAEPVFGALFAHLYGGEPLLNQHLIGGGFIFAGMILAEIRPGMWERINGLRNGANGGGEKKNPVVKTS
ncbi:MAG: DMT family transporter [Thermodesulfobacteriota bacterium]